jgi:hypothetical protein
VKSAFLVAMCCLIAGCDSAILVDKDSAVLAPVIATVSAEPAFANCKVVVLQCDGAPSSTPHSWMDRSSGPETEWLNMSPAGNWLEARRATAIIFNGTSHVEVLRLEKSDTDWRASPQSRTEMR